MVTGISTDVREQQHSHPLFAGLSPAVVRRVVDRLEHRRFSAGATVLPQGHAHRELYLVCAGAADLVLTDRRGVERHVGHVGPGDTLGELALLSGQPSSVGVRAATDLEVLVLREEDFHHATAVFPHVYRNLGQILAERLARTHLTTVRAPVRALAVLLDQGAPPLLGYAFACSVAWHTRAQTLVVLVGDDWPAEVHALAANAPVSLDGARAHLSIVPSAEMSDRRLRELVDAAGAVDGHLLVQVRGDHIPAWLEGRRVRLVGHSERMSHSGLLTLRAWTQTAGPYRPDGEGILDVPSPGGTDQRALAFGLLATHTPLGRAVGWAARDVARLKVGLALGAGCEKGYAHVGVLRTLARVGLEADYIAGTSIGAAVGAMYAAGYEPEAAAAMMDRIAADVFRPTLPIRSMLSGDGVGEGVRRVAGSRRFEDLPIPLGIVTADILTQRAVVFREGLLWPPLLGSMAIPGVFPPRRVGPHLLVDGTLVDPVPGRVARDMGADVVIAVRLAGDPPPTPDGRARLPALPRVLARAVATMQDHLTAHAAAAATVLIEPELGSGGRWGLRRFRDGRRFIEPGERAADAALPHIKAALPWLRGSTYGAGAPHQ